MGGGWVGPCRPSARARAEAVPQALFKYKLNINFMIHTVIHPPFTAPPPSAALPSRQLHFAQVS